MSYNKMGVMIFVSLFLWGCSESEAPPSEIISSDIDTQRIKNANSEPGNWFTTGRTFGETHYSPLSDINKESISTLGFAWNYDTGTTRGLESTPIVVDGKMYTSGTWGRVYALDAKTGEELWYFEPPLDGQVAGDACCDIVNRGVALYGDNVYVAALDGQLHALNKDTGEIVWSQDTIVDHSRRYTVTGAPRVAGDVVVIGNSGAEFDARGYVSAYDLKSGEFKWRFYIVPGDPKNPPEHIEMVEALKTWDPNSRWDVGGGGTAWDTMTYDPELNLLYVGTGNSAPYPAEVRSPSGGDNLYLSSILAINPDTGRLKWHYQTTPADSWDFTATQNMILTDLEIEGRTRKVLMQAPKNGFFYVIDRDTGELLSANNYVPVTWATHVDLETGRPQVTAASKYFSEPKVQSPTDMGGHNWKPMAYNKDTGLVYIPVTELEWLRVNAYPDGYEYEKGLINMGSWNFPTDDATIEAFASFIPYEAEYLKEIVRKANPAPDRELLRAWDPIKGEIVWDVENSSQNAWDGGGILTSGGLVFQGNSQGFLRVFEASSGELLKSIEVGTSIMAAPMTYTVDGEQYIALMAGYGGAGAWSFPESSAAYKRGNDGRVVVFKLGGGDVPLPPMLEFEPFPEPPAQGASLEQISNGQKLYSSICAFCHANSDRNLVPDLRRLTLEKHAQFEEIVLGGLFKQNGMPSFEGIFTKEEVADIHAFIISFSKASYEGNTK
ncbi:MAG: PQQ-dependent dehydrogenase, methanol/ethanol family [Sphingomonadales bacterium]